MLPYLKNKEGSASSHVEVLTRDHDESYDMLDAVAEDLSYALSMQGKERKSTIKAALESLCEYIRTVDMAQDEEY